MDTEKNKDIPKQFEVSRLPEVLLFKNGELVDRILGAKPQSTFAEAVTKQL
jgi:thioredoxin 1